jgi:hypothetical protein
MVLIVDWGPPTDAAMQRFQTEDAEEGFLLKLDHGLNTNDREKDSHGSAHLDISRISREQVTDQDTYHSRATAVHHT